MHTITLKRDTLSPLSTIGTLTVGDVQVETLEDTRRAHKVYGETRIPAGTYELNLRDEGNMVKRYKSRYDWHKGMIWLRNVPEFEFIYIHPGNNPGDTLGCILVGMTRGENFIGNSRAAYQKIYPAIVWRIENGGCQIVIEDEEG